MSTLARVVFGVLLAVGMTGCGANVAPPMMSAEQQCERNGGAWHSASELCAHDGPNNHGHGPWQSAPGVVRWCRSDRRAARTRSRGSADRRQAHVLVKCVVSRRPTRLR